MIKRGLKAVLYTRVVTGRVLGFKFQLGLQTRPNCWAGPVALSKPILHGRSYTSYGGELAVKANY